MRIRGEIDFTLTDWTEERVVAEMPITAGVKNPLGIVNAGAILWFADVVASTLILGPRDSAPTEGASGFPLAIALNANFLGNQTSGAFKAVSVFVKKGKTVSVVRTTIYGANEKLIADVTTNHVLPK